MPETVAEPQDLAELNSWYAAWGSLRVAVIGLGETGFAAADTLVELGAAVKVFAAAADNDRELLLKVIGAQFELCSQSEFETALRAFTPDVVVLAADTEPSYLQAAHEAAAGLQAQMWSCAELAWRVADKVQRARWLCVTGESEIAETVELAARMLLEAGVRVAPVGVGQQPILDAVRDPAGFDVYVVGFNSADLQFVKGVFPLASAVLNIAAEPPTPHNTTAEYYAALSNIYTNTETACVYNRHETAATELVAAADVQEGCRAVSFGVDTPPVAGLGIVDNVLADRGFHPERRTSALELATLEQLTAKGLSAPQQVANFLAASALVRACGVGVEHIHAALEDL